MKKPSKDPNLATIRVVAAALEHRNLTQAAADLGMTQPAVSFHLRRFELLYGFTVLARQGNVFVPTSAGLEALYHCRQIIAAHEAMVSIEIRRTPKVLMPPDFMGILLRSGELTELANKFHCVTSVPDSAQRAFESRELALFVRYLSPRDTRPRWSFRVPMVWVGAEKFDNAEWEIPFVRVPERVTYGRLAEEYAPHSSKHLRLMTETSDANFIYQAVRAGAAVTFIPRNFAQSHGLRQLTSSVLLPFDAEIGIDFHEDLFPEDAARHLLEEFTRVAGNAPQPVP